MAGQGYWYLVEESISGQRVEQSLWQQFLLWRCGVWQYGGFLQSLKYKDIEEQRHICRLSGKEAKRMTTASWQEDQTVWWKGQTIDRQSKMFLRLVRAAYKAMFEQNESFRTALMSTCGKVLYHSQGAQDSHKTILTEKEFCSILTELRDNEKKYYNGV